MAIWAKRLSSRPAPRVSESSVKGLPSSRFSYRLSSTSSSTSPRRTALSPSSHRRKSPSRSSRWPLSRSRAEQKEWMVEIWAL